MIRLLLPAIALLLALAAPNLRAWDPLGHMLVARIAQTQLTPAARAELDAALVRFNQREKSDAPYDFVIAACWMDDIRSRTKDFNAWHYVNLPFTREGTPLPAASREAPNVVWGIDACNAIITGEVTDPAIDRDQAIVMLLHLVGDVHQPLHATSRGEDLGGNRVKIKNLKDPLVDLIFTKGGNLHFFWDSAYRRVYKGGSATVFFEAPLYDRFKPVTGHEMARSIVEREAEALMKKYPVARMTAPQADATTWALESHQAGFDFAYGKLPPGPDLGPLSLTSLYVEQARPLAEARLVLAGYRLGALLNRLLDPTATSNPPTAESPKSASEPGSGTAE